MDSYLSLGQPDTAVYWADKLVSLSQKDANNGSDPSHEDSGAEDMHRLARGLLATRQPHRAAHLVRKAGLHTKHLGCCHVATMALYQVRLPRKILHVPPTQQILGWRDGGGFDCSGRGGVFAEGGGAGGERQGGGELGQLGLLGQGQGARGPRQQTTGSLHFDKRQNRTINLLFKRRQKPFKLP